MAALWRKDREGRWHVIAGSRWDHDVLVYSFGCRREDAATVDRDEVRYCEICLDIVGPLNLQHLASTLDKGSLA